MSAEHVRARTGAYADSVTLMAVSARAQAVPGVRAALIAMGTDLNLELLAGLGLAPPAGVGQNDMLIAIRADDSESLGAALTVVDEALGATGAAGGSEPGGTGPAPRTTRSAVSRAGPGLALISVPGQHAFAEALDALGAGCDVMIFSDNVPVEQEIVLKDIAAERGLLVMGPDCGTAIVAGVGLGFSQSVAPGPIGLVAASGTGAQQVVCLLDAAGTGVSAVLGVGGRDLSAAVSGRSARAALAALDEDPAIKLIVLLSKPPDAGVAAGLRSFAATLATPVQFALIGPGQPDLTAATEAALRAIGLPVPDWPRWSADPKGQAAPSAATDRPRSRPGERGAGGPGERGARRSGQPGQRSSGQRGERGAGGLRGLFCGGTLCDEAMVIAAERLGPVYSNVPLRPDWRIDPLLAVDQRPPAARPVMIDFGDDALTAGRPHPMIDQRMRLDRLAAEVADPATAVIMLDVVLGHGAHPDPASEVAPAITAATASDFAVVVSLVGASADPQGLGAQADALAAAGAHVFASNAQAARFACDLIDHADRQQQ